MPVANSWNQTIPTLTSFGLNNTTNKEKIGEPNTSYETNIYKQETIIPNLSPWEQYNNSIDDVKIVYQSGVDGSLLSQSTITSLKKAAARSGKKEVQISSTFRDEKKQAKELYNNLIGGKSIKYKKVGEAVKSLGLELINKGCSRDETIEKMADKIVEFRQQGLVTSKHCVDENTYRMNNTVDISKTYPLSEQNLAEKFTEELSEEINVSKILHPFSSISKNKCEYSRNEKCIHVEFN